MSEDPDLAVVLDQALDALEEVVRQWVHAGGGRYWHRGTSTDDVIADLLVVNRPQRWERTASGLRWHPE